MKTKTPGDFEMLFTRSGIETELHSRNDKGSPFGVGDCPRCSGTGKHSFCETFRDVCFQCRGEGEVLVRLYTDKELASINRRKEKVAAEKAAKIAVNRKVYAERRARENAEIAAHAAAEKARLAPAVEKLSPLADALEDGKGGFCDSVASDLRCGHLPRGRGADLVCDIIAKSAGRRNSNAYKVAFKRVSEVLTSITI
jgi:hypothetical protein